MALTEQPEAPDSVDEALDVTGLNCPLPILKTKRALARLPVGTVLHVVATDPHAVVDFRAFFAGSHHNLLHVREDEAGERFEFWIRREAQSASA